MSAYSYIRRLRRLFIGAIERVAEQLDLDLLTVAAEPLQLLVRLSVTTQMQTLAPF